MVVEPAEQDPVAVGELGLYAQDGVIHGGRPGERPKDMQGLSEDNTTAVTGCLSCGVKTGQGSGRVPGRRLTSTLTAALTPSRTTSWWRAFRNLLDGGPPGMTGPTRCLPLASCCLSGRGSSAVNTLKSGSVSSDEQASH
jgi:hypothetical protein